jgi:hypothetical protein
LAISSQLSSGSNFLDKDRERRLYACLLLLQQPPFERWRDENVTFRFVIFKTKIYSKGGWIRLLSAAFFLFRNKLIHHL